MKFSYNWLQSYFQKKLPAPEKLAEILTLHFAEVEDVKKEGSDFVLNIDVRPNRAGDCFSHNGVAREISAILNLNLIIIKFTSASDPDGAKRFYSWVNRKLVGWSLLIGVFVLILSEVLSLL